MRRTLAAAGLLLFVANSLSAESRIEKNVVYGMYSGLALLMDVHHPAVPNGHGIVFVQGSGFSAALGFNAAPLKEGPTVPDFAARLTASGYTVFAVNHRAVPRFQYPAAVEDVQRAVRFIRANAETYGIDPDHIGAAGGSSGGHLVSMLGTLDGEGDPEDLDPVNRLSSKVQAVVALYAPFDLTIQFRHSDALGIPEALFVGARLTETTPSNAPEYRRYAAASPITYVSPDDPPFLLFHGDKDTTVPYRQSVAMEAALRKAGVEVTFVPVPGGKHGRHFGFAAEDPRLPDYLSAISEWFDSHLRKETR